MEFKKLKIGEWFEEPRDSRKRIYIRVANGIDKDRGVIIKGEGQGYFMPFLPSDKVEIVRRIAALPEEEPAMIPVRDVVIRIRTIPCFTFEVMCGIDSVRDGDYRIIREVQNG